MKADNKDHTDGKEEAKTIRKIDLVNCDPLNNYMTN